MTLNDIAESVIQKLKGKVIIHRYDSYSTNSIYLKFDYGVANSLRISDHTGKRHLKYRYNILTDQKVKSITTDHGFERFYYSPEMINAVCRDILSAKKAKQERYRNYDAVVNHAMEKIYHEKGFWQDAKEVK